MVRIEGDAATGALTDGDGRFEISGLAPGPQLFEVLKPGFFDHPPSADADPGAAVLDDARGAAHNVIVAADMADLEFSLAPACAIRGHVELSTGDPAQGIGIVLLARKIEQGRAVWQVAGNARTGSDGSYRFGNLPDGSYALYTGPAMESDMAATFIAQGSGARMTRNGYASVYYPDARDQSGAQPIKLSNGQQAQVNFNLLLEPFHAVTATVSSPESRASAAGDRTGMGLSAVVADVQGHQLPYSAQFDPATHTIQAFLPDGTYSLQLTASARMRSLRFISGGVVDGGSMGMAPQAGSVEFSVAGRPVPNLRVALSSPHLASVQLNVLHSGASAAQPQESRGRAVVVTVSQTGGMMADGAENALATGEGPGQLDSSYAPAGQYWVHTHFEQKNLCEESFTAGGANLAREPLVLGISGAAAALDLTARDDCARLTLTLPAALSALSRGEERSVTVYVVPDFDSTTDIEPVTLRSTSGSSITMEGLTPGSYRVFTFASPVALEYRNRQALATLPDTGKQITLSPSAAANLVLEAPGR